MQTIKVTNYSNESFTCTWDKEPITLGAGQSMLMPDWLAFHFSKHLINRELIKKGYENDTSPKNPSDNAHFMAEQAKCLDVYGDMTKDKTSIAVQLDVLNEKMEEQSKTDATPTINEEEAKVAVAAAEEKTVAKAKRGRKPKSSLDAQGNQVISVSDDEEEFEGVPTE